MKNVTISMDEALLAEVRVEAAKAGLSVSRWIGRTLAEAKARQPDDDIEAAIRAIDEFLAEPTVPISEGGKAFDRSEIYDEDERFRRFDHPDLSHRPSRAEQAEQRLGVGESAHPFEGDADQRPKPE